MSNVLSIACVVAYHNKTDGRAPYGPTYIFEELCVLAKYVVTFRSLETLLEFFWFYWAYLLAEGVQNLVAEVCSSHGPSVGLAGGGSRDP